MKLRTLQRLSIVLLWLHTAAMFVHAFILGEVWVTFIHSGGCILSAKAAVDAEIRIARGGVA